ncbi:helix-turn-helix domain-containing protein [Magnetospirillum gryphiswaldense]|uniref:helix-turn-helix domain-containing protein n=1 Tax=Magnetospirillum gryphiswaldense TaxID=55518 RepID=UPI000D046D1A|nr:helix-turn-helix domain-containing protein [Magnetospirillum gryphiswaldense]AVM76065.1 Helix-turn-helix domain protein [Magnetospirillum gryphiswaldense MSR-1]AVM79968.1 Helix-turn-helix domain protein [Magnetospirillum gryphiswaldense]
MDRKQGSVKEAYSVSDFCSTYSISKSFFYELVKKGAIRPVKIGNKTVVPKSEGDRLLAGVAA